MDLTLVMVTSLFSIYIILYNTCYTCIIILMHNFCSTKTEVLQTDKQQLPSDITS